MWGHLLMAAGGLTGIASTLMVGSATFLGLGPMGWITLIAISVGLGLVYWLSASPIEDWLSAGPFGPDSGRILHLQDPDQAFYYLVSLFADIRVTVERNPEYTLPAYHQEWNPVPVEVRRADTRIRIESNLPGLLTGLGDLSLTVSCAMLKVRRLHDRLNGQTHEEAQLFPEAKPNAYRRLPDALEIFVETPLNTRIEASHSNDSVSVHAVWKVRAQLIVTDGSSIWVFPAPAPKDPTPFGLVHAKPNFEKVEQLFWADETTHKARSGQ